LQQPMRNSSAAAAEQPKGQPDVVDHHV